MTYITPPVNSPPPGNNQTKAKAWAGAIVAAVSPLIVGPAANALSQYLDPAWVQKCITADSITMIYLAVTAAGAGIFAVAAHKIIDWTRNKALPPNA